MNYDDDSDIWWDMYQVFRYQIWKETNPDTSDRNMMTIASDTPMHDGKEQLIRVEKF